MAVLRVVPVGRRVQANAVQVADANGGAAELETGICSSEATTDNNGRQGGQRGDTKVCDGQKGPRWVLQLRRPRGAVPTRPLAGCLSLPAPVSRNPQD